MIGQDLLAKLTADGCRARLDGEQLKVSGSLTDEHRELIREHKPALVAALQRQAFIANLSRQMEANGQARFHSARLNEVVHVIQSWDSLPSLPEGELVFSLTELRNMATQTYSDSELRELAAAKRAILAEHRRSLAKAQDDSPATIEDALRIFPGSRVVEKTLSGF